jgi:hypothetical protein
VPSAVFDPLIPSEDRKFLAAHEELLHPAGGVLPRQLLGGRNGYDVLFALWNMPLWGLLPGITALFYRSVPLLAAGLAAQAGLIAAFVIEPEIGVLIVAVAQPIIFLVLLGLCGEGRAGRLARELHGRYVRREDLDASSAVLVNRVQQARAVVLESKVNQQGLLDDVRNAITLPEQEWDIAQTLAELSRLRSSHQDAYTSKDPQVIELLGPQKKALDLAQASVTERIVALEKYAERTIAADEALKAWETVQRLASNSDAYTDLLARTVRDELAIAEIDGLAEQARGVEEALRNSVAKARRAGLALVPDLKEAG